MKLEKMHVFSCSLLLAISVFSTCFGAESEKSDGDEIGVQNLVVPKTAITASCGTSATFERKLTIMENHISQLERDVKNVQMRSLYAFSRDNLKDRINAIEQRLQITDVLKGDLKHHHLPNRHADNRQTTVGDKPYEFEDMLKDRFNLYFHPLIRKELEIIKEEMKKEFWDAMLQTIRNNDFPGQNSHDNSKEDNKEPTFNDSSEITHFPDNTEKQNHHNQHHSYHHHHRPQSTKSETEVDNQILKKDNLDVPYPLGNEFPDAGKNQQYYLQNDWSPGHGRSAIYHPRAHQNSERNQAQDPKKPETPKDDQILETLKRDMINMIDSRIKQLRESAVVYREEIDKKVDELSNSFENRTSILESRMQQFEDLYQTLHTSLLKRLSTNTQQLQDFTASVDTMRNSIIHDTEFQRTMHETMDVRESSLMTKFTTITNSVKSDIQDLTKKYERVQHYQVELENIMLFNQNQTMINMSTIKNNISKLLEFVHEVKNDLYDFKNETSFNFTNLASAISAGKGHSEIISEGINLRYTMDKVKNLENLIANTQQNVDGLEVKHSNDMLKLEATILVLQTNVSEIQISQMTQNERMVVIGNAVENVTKSVNYIQLDLLELQISDQKWMEFNFEYEHRHSDCYGNKYVRKTNYELGKIVGVVLCSPGKYKIFLGESLREPFRDIGDMRRMGEDHCEFVGAQNEARAKVGRIGQQMRIIGYKRRNWGEVPRLGIISLMNPIPAWYQCGVTIP